MQTRPEQWSYWTDAQRLRVLAALGPDLPPDVWADRMSCDVQTIWRLSALVRRGNRYSRQALAGETP